MKNKTITEGIEAIVEISTQKVKQQFLKGDLRPHSFETLDGHEQLYVKLIVFEKRSPDAACRIVAKKLNDLKPEIAVTPEDLRVRYMFSSKIKEAINDFLNARDVEESLMIQGRASLAQSIVAGLMVNSESEEIRLRAAVEIMKQGALDHKNKRAKETPNKQVTNNNVVIWKIEQHDGKEQLPDEHIIDATIVKKETPKVTIKSKPPKQEKNDTPLEMSFYNNEEEDEDED